MASSKILKGLNVLLKKCNALKKSFTSEINREQESLKISKILSQIKIFIANSFGRDTEQYKIVDYTAATYTRRILDKVIAGLESIRDSYDPEFEVDSYGNSNQSIFKFFNMVDDNRIEAQYLDQHETHYYRRIFEHGDRVPLDYSATGVQWDPYHELFTSRSIYGERIDVLHKSGVTYIDEKKILNPIVLKFSNDFSRGRFNRPAYYGEWEVASQLPRGGQAAVFKVKRDSDDIYYALKSFIINSKTSKKYKRYKREVKLLKIFKDNENVIKLIDEGNKVDYQSKTYYYYVMELANITLKDLILKNDQLSFENKVSIFRQIIDAFHPIHKEGYVHRDIKPQNLLFKDKKVKIADFGLVYHKDFPRLSNIGERVGPIDFICPESEDGRADVDFRCDFYALGKILYFLLSGGVTFSREQEKFEEEEDYRLEVINDDDRFKAFLPFLRKTINRRVENRYASIPELRKAFDTCVEQFYKE